MSNVIKIKKSGSAGNAPSSLEHGELALNYADGALYYKDSGDVIVRYTDSLNQVLSKGNSSSLGMTIGSLNVDSGTLFVNPTNDRVGVGTTNPSQKLSVSGNISCTGNISATNGNISANSMSAGTISTLSGVLTPTLTVNNVVTFNATSYIFGPGSAEALKQSLDIAGPTDDQSILAASIFA
jgi:hypothetical protein